MYKSLVKDDSDEFWAQLDFDGLQTMDKIAPVYWAKILTHI
jgi:hypothetical protein